MIRIDTYITQSQYDKIETCKGDNKRSEFIRRIIDFYFERIDMENKIINSKVNK